MRQLAQHFMRVGQQQYERGYYAEADKTFQKAQGYAEFLEPLEQRRLQSLREKVRVAAAERRRVLETRQTAEELARKGDAVTARAHLEQLRDSEFLTEQERLEVADMLRRAGQSNAGATGADVAGSNVAPQLPASKPTEVRSVPGDALERYKKGIADLHNESVKAFHAGDYRTAREGFTRVLRSGLMPPSLTETIRGYLADIDRVQAGQSNVRPVVLGDEAATMLPTLGTTALANTPANGTAAQSEQERIEELYNRSRELYTQGELVAARQGFEEVAQSGLFTAPAGRRPEDYIATIDRLLAASQGAEPSAAQPTPGVPPVQPTPAVPVQPNGMAAAEEGGFVEIINRRRNIIRSHTDAVVTDAINQAQTLMAQGEFAAAQERLTTAQRVVNENQLYLGDELYRQYTQRLNDTAARLREAEEARARQMAEQKRQEAAEAQQELREQAEIDRERRIDELMERARAYWKQQQYEAALGQLEALLAIDPLHDEALSFKQMVEDMIYLRKQLELNRLTRQQAADIKMATDESSVPYADDITYPKNWREIIQRPTRQPDKPIGLDPANMLVYEQLDTVVDLSAFSPQMPISEAVEVLRNSVQPPLNIVMLWRDLLENGDIEPTDPINMDGLPGVRLGTALESLISAISNPLIAEVDYVVNKGVITVGTLDGLPAKKMETRVYDITDLIGQPANYSQMGQMMGMMGGMMGGGMMGGGMMGGGMGGYGGGMMGGGMMGGGMMGGGYGGGLGGGGLGGGLGGGGLGGGLGGGYGGGLGGGGFGGGGLGGGGYGGGMMGGGGYGGGMMGGGMMGGGMMGGGMMGGGMGMGMGNYQSQSMAYSLRSLIQENIDPDTWFDLSETGEGQIMIFPSDAPKKLAVYQTPEVHEQIEELLDQLRKSLGNEVAIEARFLVVTENFLEDIGLDLDFSYDLGGKWGVITVEQDSFLTGAPDVSTRVPGSLGGLTNNPAANVVGGYGSILDDLQVSFIIRATQARTDSKALAAPKVTVLNGEGANFSITDEITYALPPTLTSTQAVGGVGATAQQGGVYQNINLTQVGSQLSITPTITKDKKYVLLNIVSQQLDLLRFRTHQVSTINPATTTTGGAGGAANQEILEYPVTVPEREISSVATRVSVPDRGTLLLGGHKLAAEVDKEVGVPILSKIPLLGRLFTNRSSIRDQKILLILVKPTIILQEEAEQDAIAAMEETVGSAF